VVAQNNKVSFLWVCILRMSSVWSRSGSEESIGILSVGEQQEQYGLTGKLNSYGTTMERFMRYSAELPGC
jgi:hypothetical protein